MSKKNRFKAEDVMRVIPGTGGVISTIAERLGCAWHTAQKYIYDHPSVNQAYRNEKKTINDKAVSVVITAIRSGDLETSKWWLRMKLPAEFSPRQEMISNTDSSLLPITTVVAALRQAEQDLKDEELS